MIKFPTWIITANYTALAHRTPYICENALILISFKWYST